MSSGQELREFYDELSTVPEDLRTEVTRKFGRLTALKILDGNTSFQKDMARLDAKQRAIYRMQGVPMREEDDTRITNILGDNCTITMGDEEEQAAAEDKPQPTPTPAPQPPATKPNGMPTWAKWALGAAIAASGLGPLGTAYFLTRPTDQSGGSVFAFDTELPPGWSEDAE